MRTWIRVPFLLLLVYLGVLGTVKIFFSIYDSKPFYSTAIPRYHIESWTLGANDSFDHSTPFYGAKNGVSSPIYMKIPYHANYLLSSALGFVEGIPVVAANRVVNVGYAIASLLCFSLILGLLSGQWLTSLLSVLSLSSQFWDIYHIGYAFPHEFTKFFLAMWFSVIFYELVTGKRKPCVGIPLLVIAPFVRQTFVFISLFSFLIYFLPLEKYALIKKKKEILLLILCSILCFAHLFYGSSFKDVVFWVFELPSKHPRSFELLPSMTLHLANFSLVLGLISILLTKRHIANPLLMTIFLLVGYFTCIFHSTKMGSGAHMVDTVLFISVLLAALNIVMAFKDGFAYLLCPFFAFVVLYFANSGPLGHPSLGDFESHYISLREAHSQATKENEEILKILNNRNDLVNVYGFMPEVKNMKSVALLSSLFDTSYSRPRYDEDFWREQALRAPRRYIGSEVGFMGSLVPAGCSLKVEREFVQTRLFILYFECVKSKE